MNSRTPKTAAMVIGMNGVGRAWWPMRRAVMLAALGLAVVTLALLGGRPAPAQAQTSDGTVWLYQHPNFGGRYKEVWAGWDDFRLADLRQSYFDDTATSIKVSPGLKVAVFEHPNFLGRCEVFTASDGDLRDNFIGDDTISSAKLGVDCPIVLYADPNFGGRGEALWKDNTDLSDLYQSWWQMNDTVTSIRVPKGLRVAVYRGANYSGVCETFTADDTDLRNNRIGDDTISSYRLGAS